MGAPKGTEAPLDEAAFMRALERAAHHPDCAHITGMPWAKCNCKPPMTLAEAILHSREKSFGSDVRCANEHAKLAEWLEELQVRRLGLALENEAIPEKRNIKWWALCVTHNIVVHPFLPLADALDSLGFKKIPKAIYWAHDNSVPSGGG